ncbi:RNA pseudouridine synthase 7 isoform X3 [Vigna angularis]|uniref:RNA pseudouridine synthase 7 isoform X3 n=1 Tax=Phaseolus angularis TaxID=3914 RepID=UPI00080A4DEE|nr:RNA pseudouridine synthase 7 isoform X3 [Vigna angularis]
MKRKRGGEEEGMDIVWQTPANPPHPHDYVFRNGIRFVRPYYFEFIAHVKNRWAGKTIVDLFAEEFKGRPYDYYVSAVKCGRIQVDGEIVPVSYVVKPSQKISHFLHRHEPPVMACDVVILQNEPDVLTICKPASVPLLRRYTHVVNIGRTLLLAFFKLSMAWHLYFVSKNAFWGRDKWLLILARNAAKADIFRQQIEAGLVHKQYIAKVVGEFPEDKLIVDANIEYNAREGRSTAEGKAFYNDLLSVARSLFLLVRDSAKGKAACTKFTRISTNGTQSIVLCEPITGRTHQIRVHLQYSGHPIANDMLYLSEQTVDRSVKGWSADRSARISNVSLTSDLDEVLNACEENSNEDFSIDPMCTNCPNLAPKGYDGDEDGLWLHCIRYTGPGWAYECPYPDWAKLI